MLKFHISQAQPIAASLFEVYAITNMTKFPNFTGILK